METGLGALFGAGWTVDDLLDHTMPQVEMAIRATARHRAVLVDAVLGAIGVRKERPKAPDGSEASLADWLTTRGVRVQDG